MKNDDIAQKIVEYIKINRVSTTEIADALGKTGLVDPELKILVPGTRAVGIIHYVPAVNGSNWHTHQYISDTPEHSVIFIDALGCEGRAIFGSLVAKYALLYRQASGVIVKGLVRDAHILMKERYPIWSYGVSPIGCVNEETDFDEEAFKKKKEIWDGSIMIADDSGVVAIRKEQLTEEFYSRLEWIEEQEDLWFDCIDRLKYDTFETVCLKKYKTERK
ncbi:RraA family protein [Paenibacillus sp. FSL H8-0034]|uniref:RraA family protein n=1 Tax=Paenibacillus sp. FSL H8-0034 TaxID=2954671 RepID=UPI0030F8A8B6